MRIVSIQLVTMGGFLWWIMWFGSKWGIAARNVSGHVTIDLRLSYLLTSSIKKQ